MEEGDINRVGAPVGPVCVCGGGEGEVGLGTPGGEVGRDVDFDTHLFGELGCAVGVVGLGVTAGDEDAAIVE